MQALLKDDQVAIEYLRTEVEELRMELTKPSLEALLALKDQLAIPDDDWDLVVRTFGAKAVAKLHRLEALQRRMNNELPITPTAGGRGWEVVC